MIPEDDECGGADNVTPRGAGLVPVNVELVPAGRLGGNGDAGTGRGVGQQFTPVVPHFKADRICRQREAQRFANVENMVLLA